MSTDEEDDARASHELRKALCGKQIANVTVTDVLTCYRDNSATGTMTITFTDGSKLEINEGGQAGYYEWEVTPMTERSRSPTGSRKTCKSYFGK